MKSMITLALVAAALIGAVPCGGAACWESGRPESVLRCYEEAYSAMSAEAVRALLAPDFLLEYSPRPEGQLPIDRDSEVKQLTTLFESARNVQLRFAPGYTVKRGDTPGTWRIEETGWTNTVELSSPAGTATVHEVRGSFVTILVRETPAPERRYQIYRIVQSLR